MEEQRKFYQGEIICEIIRGRKFSTYLVGKRTAAFSFKMITPEQAYVLSLHWNIFVISDIFSIDK